MKPTSTTTTTTTSSNNLTTMESLALPLELYWDGKMEPTSPPSSDLFSLAESTTIIALDNWLHDEHLSNEIKLFSDDTLEFKYDMELTDELINGDDLIVEICDLKDEHWNDSKLLTQQHLLDYQIGAPASPPLPLQQPTTITKVLQYQHQNSNVYDSGSIVGGGETSTLFDTAILTQLTPPQSPPLLHSNVAAATVGTSTFHHHHQQQQQQQHHNNHQISQNTNNLINVTTNFLNVLPQQQQQQQLSATSSATLNLIPTGTAATATGTGTVTASIPTTSSHNSISNALSSSLSPLSSSSLSLKISSPTSSSVVQNIQQFTTNWLGNDDANNAETDDANMCCDADIARETKIVDEIIEIRMKELANWADDDECESQLSSAASQADISSIATEEEDWLPDATSSSSSAYGSSSSAGSSPVHLFNSSGGGAGAGAADTAAAAATTGTPKKRTRPYGRGVEDRKIRKKEQNKNAATRYRQKKKLEMEHVLSEEQQLALRHDELKRNYSDLKREAKYLKTLIREFYANKRK